MKVINTLRKTQRKLYRKLNKKRLIVESYSESSLIVKLLFIYLKMALNSKFKELLFLIFQVLNILR